jgi:sarcosine oxidase
MTTVEGADVAVVGGGGLGSATAWQLARRGVDVVLVERFAFGHRNGASHDTSRILRRSYHTPGYVRLAGEAYDDWALLSSEAGEQLVTTTGGVDLFPPGAAIPAVDYAGSMAACGVPFDELSAAEVAARWPAFAPPQGTVAIYQEDTSIVPAGRSTATMRRLARTHGARLYDGSPVTAMVDGGDGVELTLGPDGWRLRASRVVLTADAWTNELLAHLGAALPLTVLREQVTYFAPARPQDFGPHRLPVWIWMDDPSFYGFPTYAEGGHGGLVKAAQDCGGAPTTAYDRSFDPDPTALDRLRRFVVGLLPGVGAAHHTVTCLYTLTPDRDFVVDTVPNHPSVCLGLGAAHGFKFAPTFGRLLADLATAGATTSDIAAFAMDRPALVDRDYRANWLV